MLRRPFARLRLSPAVQRAASGASRKKRSLHRVFLSNAATGLRSKPAIVRYRILDPRLAICGLPHFSQSARALARSLLHRAILDPRRYVLYRLRSQKSCWNKCAQVARSGGQSPVSGFSLLHRYSMTTSMSLLSPAATEKALAYCRSPCWAATRYSPAARMCVGKAPALSLITSPTAL